MGKRDKGGFLRRKGTHLAAAAILLLTTLASAGGTLAWLSAETIISNSFTVAALDIEIKETFDGKTKSQVQVSNLGDATAYIRVALIPVWQDDNQSPVGIAASLDDLEIVWGKADSWIKGTDGYWYYTQPLRPGAETEPLIQSAVVKSELGKTYHMNLQVLSDAIQAEPDEAVAGTWGVSVEDGIIIRVP